VCNGYPYPEGPDRYLAATAAHITHMLRDFVSDLDDGYINIPCDYLGAQNIRPEDIDTPVFRKWVQGQVELARKYFQEGKCYLDRLDVLRCKIAGYWYCVRFECVLDAIENDGYILRVEYNERRKISTWLTLAKLAATLTCKHLSRQYFRDLSFAETHNTKGNAHEEGNHKKQSLHF
jgi:phytoene/squalene synthetase